MNKFDISKAVHDVHGGISYSDAQEIVELILEIIKKRLIRGEKVLISGFGCFRTVARKDRMGVNPQTGVPMVIRGRKVVVFKPSKQLKSL